MASAVFALLAVGRPDWLEALGVDPDHGTGTVEWVLPLGLALAALVLGLMAGRHWRMHRARTVQSEA
jgi:hypothetical protein